MWQLKGDKNSRFYHKAIQKRRCRNVIKKIFWNDEWITSPLKLKEAFSNHFSAFFRKRDLVVKIHLGYLCINKLSHHESEWLDMDICLEELDLSLKGLSTEKVHGPDG